MTTTTATLSTPFPFPDPWAIGYLSWDIPFCPVLLLDFAVHTTLPTCLQCWLWDCMSILGLVSCLRVSFHDDI